MADIDEVKRILQKYEELKINDVDLEDEGWAFVGFAFKNNQFSIVVNKIDPITEMPMIIANNDIADYPHIMGEYEYKDKKIRYICLLESTDFVKSLLSLEEKISLLIEQLLRLFQLSKSQIEKEYQKEFLYYWDASSKNEDRIYLLLSEDNKVQQLSKYKKENSARFISNNIKQNDKAQWKHDPNPPIYYIPIIDNRGILPPTLKGKWSKKDIVNIIDDRQCSKISNDTYKFLSEQNFTGRELILVFGMKTPYNTISFACSITFRLGGQDKLLTKLLSADYNIACLETTRCDYEFLNKQIGNDISLLDKKVAIIGAGSLGSYVANEVIRSGVKQLTIYDDDTLSEQNILRHTIGMSGVGYTKVIALKATLQHIHPEILVNSISARFFEDNVTITSGKYDLIIFTVGSSDTQLECNKEFSKAHNKEKVIYAWLEADGINSHVLYVDYKNHGCFQCLFTDTGGALVNNKVNVANEGVIEERTIRNSCGGTRVAYGTEIISRTTSVIINTLKKIFTENCDENFLIDINPQKVDNRKLGFYESKCRCCNEN
ncbi:MAG TPA: hypothetical protein GXX75_22665 [Clostridiales bacterium]|nr:hypothetical protein [Clostridiales bacterium]